jgi:hypothetical protein
MYYLIEISIETPCRGGRRIQRSWRSRYANPSLPVVPSSTGVGAEATELWARSPGSDRDAVTIAAPRSWRLGRRVATSSGVRRAQSGRESVQHLRRTNISPPESAADCQATGKLTPRPAVEARTFRERQDGLCWLDGLARMRVSINDAGVMSSHTAAGSSQGRSK